MQSAKLHFRSIAVALFVCSFVSTVPALSQTPTVAPPATPTTITPSQAPTQAPPKLVAPSAEECLVRVRGFEPTLMRLKETCKSTLSAIIPDPVAYEKTLPAFDKVIAEKDAKNLRNYGGLSEAFYYAGDKEKGKDLFSKFEANAVSLLGAEDTFLGLVKGDIGLLFFFENNYPDAETYVLDALTKVEPHMTAANSNNVLSSYMCLALIYDKTSKNDKALEFAKKAVELAIRQRQEPMK
jgi:tetratricopeptide (TPR) repeat protein